MVLKRVLITHKKYPYLGLDILKDKVDYYVIPYLDHEEEYLPELKRQIEKGYDAIIWATNHNFTKELIALAGAQLKAVVTLSSGYNHIDVESLEARGIPLGHTAHVQSDAVADTAVGLLIAASRRFKECTADLERGNRKNVESFRTGLDIKGSTIGIIGMGSIGRAIVRRLKGFDVEKFIYCGRTDKIEATALGVKRVNVDELLNSSDYVILACPLTSKTKNFINSETLNKMKKDAVLVNVARGGIVDQDALYKALKEKRIFAAGLDVTTPEPLPKDHPLISLPNCYILPHIASETRKTMDAMVKIAATDLLLALDGKPMKNPVIPVM